MTSSEHMKFAHFWVVSVRKYMVQNIAEKKIDPKYWNGKILNTFGPYIFWMKQLKSVQISYVRY